ncbi:MAG: hypothetical protein QM619_10090 [Micropruina sp.]|uniref:hypothetical protein n=1 Tax=Micropruina sp. TaxID=2737536 RepID=UPI0039E71009
MAKQTKKFAKVVRDLESAIGVAVVTGRSDTGEVSPLFVAVFGTANGATTPSVLGSGELVQERLVLVDLDVAAALRAGATPTSVGIAWLTGSTPHTQARAVGAFGHRKDEVTTQATMWMLELATPSTAPLGFEMPPDVSPASAWCFWMPWLSMCHKN